VVGLAVYLNTLFNDFVIDDRLQIVDNPYVHKLEGLRQIFTSDVWAFAGEKGPGVYYRPLMYACWVPVWRVCEASPVGYHVLNVLLHAGVALVVALWLLRMQANPTTAWLAALLFAVHPVHTEAVAWISALPDLQCALFFLLGFWLYLGAERAEGWRRYALLTGVGVCVLLALLAKEIGVALPAMLFLYGLERRRRETGNSREGQTAAAPSRRSEKLFFYVALALAVIAYLLMRRQALGGANVASALPVGVGARLMAGWVGLLYWYTRLLVLPVRLSAFHVLPLPTGFLDPPVLAGLAAAAGWIGLAVWLRHRRRREWLGVALLLVSLLPSFLAPLRVQGFWIGERYLYLPSVGFCWLLAAALDHLLRRRRAMLVALAAALALLYAARTVVRNADWRQEIPFYFHELRTEQESRQLRALLAGAMLRRGMPEQALQQARAWVRVTPDDKRAHSMLGEIYWTLENPEQAVSESRQAAVLARRQGGIAFAAQEFTNLAVLLGQTGHLDDSLDAYRQAVELDPNLAEARFGFGLALKNAGKPQEAAVQFRSVARLSPQSVWAHANLAVALAAGHHFADARAAMAEALRLQPDSAEVLAYAGEVEQAAGDREAARQWFQRALVVDPANLRARTGLSSLR
jgi:tetratricopeptide (TPR) repeat protein